MATISAKQAYADNPAEIAKPTAFLRVARDVDLACRFAVAGKASFAVIFRDQNSVGGPSVQFCFGRENLALGPVRRGKIGTDYPGFPFVRAGLAVADQFWWRCDLDHRLISDKSGKTFVHEPPENRGYKAFEAHSILVDRRLVGGHHFAYRGHLCRDKPRFALILTVMKWLRSVRRQIGFSRLRENTVAGQPLVAAGRIVDQVLVRRDDSPGRTQQRGKFQCGFHVRIRSGLR